MHYGKQPHGFERTVLCYCFKSKSSDHLLLQNKKNSEQNSMIVYRCGILFGHIYNEFNSSAFCYFIVKNKG